MADSDKDILITPNRNMGDTPAIVFTGKDGSPITLYVLDTGSLSIEGSSGQLFSVSDDFSGSIFSVNNISGLPSIEVFDDGEVRLAEFAGNIGIGGVANSQNKLTVSGSVNIVGSLTASLNAYFDKDITVNGTNDVAEIYFGNGGTKYLQWDGDVTDKYYLNDANGPATLNVTASLATVAQTANTATNATNATNIGVTDASADTTTWVLLGTNQTGTQGARTDGGLTYNASSNTLNATTFNGSLSGNATTATTATNATNIGVTDAGSDTTTWVLLGTDQTGTQGARTDGGLTYNASSNALTATTFVGDLVGTSSWSDNTVTASYGLDFTASSLHSVDNAYFDKDITVNGTNDIAEVYFGDGTKYLQWEGDTTQEYYLIDANGTATLNVTASLATLAQTANTATNATNATNIGVTDAGSDTTTWVLLGTGQTGTQGARTDGGLTYNASSNALTATTFNGSLSGNATTATTATNIGVTDASADTTTWVLLGTDQTGTQGARTDGGLTYNASSNALTATTFVGDLVGTSSWAENASTASYGLDFTASSIHTIGNAYFENDITVNGSNDVAEIYFGDDATKYLQWDGDATQEYYLKDNVVGSGAATLNVTASFVALAGAIPTATETTEGQVEFATQAEVDAGQTVPTNDQVMRAGENRTTITGTNGLHIGEKLPASRGTNTVAIGHSLSTALTSIAIGNNATGSSTGAIAIGNRAESRGYFGVSIGYKAESANSSSLAVGTNASSNSSSSMAIGDRASGSGDWSIAIGAGSTTESNDGIAIGHKATATASGSISIGHHPYITVPDSIVIGTGTADSGYGRHIMMGTSSSLGGTYSNDHISIGSRNSISGYASSGRLAIGYVNTISGNYGNGIAIGQSVTTIGESSGAGVGIGTNVTADQISVAIGYNTTTLGGYRSVAIGASSFADAAYTVAIGSTADASGADAIAIGRGVNAVVDGVSIGSAISATSTGILIGRSINVSSAGDTIAIGLNLTPPFYGTERIVIGYRSGGYPITFNADNQIVLGTAAHGVGTDSIAIGHETTGSTNGFAIGNYVATTGATSGASPYVGEIGIWPSKGVRGSSIRMSSPNGQVTFTIEDRTTPYIDGGATIGTEINNTLMRDAYALRRSGTNIYLDHNSASVIHTIGMSTASYGLNFTASSLHSVNNAYFANDITVNGDNDTAEIYFGDNGTKYLQWEGDVTQEYYLRDEQGIATLNVTASLATYAVNARKEVISVDLGGYAALFSGFGVSNIAKFERVVPWDCEVDDAIILFGQQNATTTVTVRKSDYATYPTWTTMGTVSTGGTNKGTASLDTWSSTSITSGDIVDFLITTTPATQHYSGSVHLIVVK